MIELRNLHGVEVAIEKLADHGRATSYRALYKAGHAVACKAWEMNQALHGPLHALPTVRKAGSGSRRGRAPAYPPADQGGRTEAS